MNRLESELQRLFAAPAADGRMKRMVLELARPASWDALRAVWQGVQADLDLPAPAIAVSGIDGYQLWFSLSEPVPAAQAGDFLESLRRRYLADIPKDRVAINPADAPTPPVQRSTGRWSAFVTPDLAALFADEPFLDLPPGLEAQADMLSRLQAIKPVEWSRALERLRPAVVEQAVAAPPPSAPSTAAGPGQDPRSFLLQVMNDTSVDLQSRIQAATALLPYFESARSK